MIEIERQCAPIVSAKLTDGGGDIVGGGERDIIRMPTDWRTNTILNIRTSFAQCYSLSGVLTRVITGWRVRTQNKNPSRTTERQTDRSGSIVS